MKYDRKKWVSTPCSSSRRIETAIQHNQGKSECILEASVFNDRINIMRIAALEKVSGRLAAFLLDEKFKKAA